MTRAIVVLWLALAVAGCGLFSAKPAKEPPARYLARGAVLAVAHAVKIVDSVCAERAVGMYKSGDEAGGIALAERCEKAYEAARKGVLAAAYAVDGWADAEDQGRAVCALNEGVAGLRMGIEALRQAGVVDLPKEIGDALAIAQWLSTETTVKQCTVGGGK